MLERDQRQPSLHVVTQLATVLALDTVALLALAHRVEAVLRQYLQTWPEAEQALLRLLVQAQRQGFVAWETVTRRLSTLEPSPVSRRRGHAAH